MKGNEENMYHAGRLFKLLGIKFDELANQNVSGECSITSSDSKVNVLRIPTNEELVIALDTELIVTEQLSIKQTTNVN